MGVGWEVVDDLLDGRVDDDVDGNNFCWSCDVCGEGRGEEGLLGGYRGEGGGMNLDSAPRSGSSSSLLSLDSSCDMLFSSCNNFMFLVFEKIARGKGG